MDSADVAVVGGGIVGLAFAYAYARRGRRVVLFERNDFAVGASVRNFGLIWPIGQAAGVAHERALRNRALWLEVIRKARLWHAPTGSLHLAYADDEWAVLQEFCAIARSRMDGELLTTASVHQRSRWVRAEGLRGGLWSPTEMAIDPRQAIRTIPRMLEEQYGTRLCFGTAVQEISLPKLRTSRGTWEVEEVVVCSGADFETLFPETFREAGLVRCKLQMLRTSPFSGGWELGPSFCGGLTLLHYDCFAGCATLPALRDRLAKELPFHLEKGIHVLVSQTARGELTIGDSHEYGMTFEPFDREEINSAVLTYLHQLAHLPPFAIAERWHGTYSKLTGRSEFVTRPADGVQVISGLGGAGMTLSLGLADEIVGGTYAG